MENILSSKDRRLLIATASHSKKKKKIKRGGKGAETARQAQVIPRCCERNHSGQSHGGGNGIKDMWTVGDRQSGCLSGLQRQWDR